MMLNAIAVRRRRCLPDVAGRRDRRHVVLLTWPPQTGSRRTAPAVSLSNSLKTERWCLYVARKHSSCSRLKCSLAIDLLSTRLIHGTPVTNAAVCTCQREGPTVANPTHGHRRPFNDLSLGREFSPNRDINDDAIHFVVF